jgi:solute carrier family 25 citrate transporter 1
VTKENPFQATRSIVDGGNGVLNLWTGTPSRTVEGAFAGAFQFLGSVATKRQLLAMGTSKHFAALAGGLVGGATQAIVLTPSSMILTTLNVNKGKPGHEHDNAISVLKRILKEKGMKGMFVGSVPMAVRQASNWATRSFVTEMCRTNLKLSRFGLVGEVGSGVIGGLGSCWNTPIETARVMMQKDVTEGLQAKHFGEYINDIFEEGGVPGLFRGVSPRSLQAIWQTVFMVVVPNLLGW